MPRGLKREDVGQVVSDWIADGDRVFISPGNMKLERIPNISLLPDLTCPGSVEECMYCYGRATIRYSTWAEARWTFNTNIAKEDLSRFEEDVTNQVYRARTLFFRIHTAGDFFSDEYLHTWFRICHNIPQTTFLAFTKSFMYDFSCKPGNMEVIWSVFPSTDFSTVPPGPRAYADFSCLGRFYPMEERERFSNAVKCTGTCASCGMCFYSSDNKFDVRFKAHGAAFNWVDLARHGDGRWKGSDE